MIHNTIVSYYIHLSNLMMISYHSLRITLQLFFCHTFPKNKHTHTCLFPKPLNEKRSVHCRLTPTINTSLNLLGTVPYYDYLCTSNEALFIKLLICATLVIFVSPRIACFITEEATAKLTTSSGSIFSINA